MADELKGRVVLVTGACGGIGLASCKVLAQAGAKLVLSDRPNSNGGAALSAARDEGAEAEFLPADLGSETDIRDLVAATVERFGRLDGAFNNAGVEQINKPLADLTLDEWNKTISIDLTAVFLCLKYQIPEMLKNGGGSIVNTASGLGLASMPNASDYVSAKHGVIGLTRSAAIDYGHRGIRVNAVLPGVIRTQMVQRVIDSDPVFRDFSQELLKRHQLGRFGEPHEIGDAAVWLLSDKASFVTGAAISVDGGYLAM